jgi:hypothetical protein
MSIQMKAPNPNPATASPLTNPFLSGNHFTPVAIGTTYAKPIPAPAITPIKTSLPIKLAPAKLAKI